MNITDLWVIVFISILMIAPLIGTIVSVRLFALQAWQD